MENKKLYNIYNKEYLSEKLSKEKTKRITCSFYKYTTIEELESTRDDLYEKLIHINVLGRIYIASEGINAQISIPNNQWDTFIKIISNYDSKNWPKKSTYCVNKR